MVWTNAEDRTNCIAIRPVNEGGMAFDRGNYGGDFVGLIEAVIDDALLMHRDAPRAAVASRNSRSALCRRARQDGLGRANMLDGQTRLQRLSVSTSMLFGWRF